MLGLCLIRISVGYSYFYLCFATVLVQQNVDIIDKFSVHEFYVPPFVMRYGEVFHCTNFFSSTFPFQRRENTPLLRNEHLGVFKTYWLGVAWRLTLTHFEVKPSLSSDDLVKHEVVSTHGLWVTDLLSTLTEVWESITQKILHFWGTRILAC